MLCLSEIAMTLRIPLGDLVNAGSKRLVWSLLTIQASKPTLLFFSLETVLPPASVWVPVWVCVCVYVWEMSVLAHEDGWYSWTCSSKWQKSSLLSEGGCGLGCQERLVPLLCPAAFSPSPILPLAPGSLLQVNFPGCSCDSLLLLPLPSLLHLPHTHRLWVMCLLF